MATKWKKVTVTIEQKLQALFRINEVESLTKIANNLGGVLLSGVIVQAIALKYNEKLEGHPAYTVSVWGGGVVSMEGLTLRSGEILSGDNVASEDFKVKFEKFVTDENLAPCQLFNADETAKLHKVKKERVTLLPYSNTSGDLKPPLLVIGKSAKPRALKDVNLNFLPAQYKTQISALMNGLILKDWVFFICGFNKEVLERDKTPRKSCVVQDNAPCHPTEEEFRDGYTFVKFLPPNVTGLIQPMDQGAIEATKWRYRKKLILSLLEQQEADPSANFIKPGTRRNQQTANDDADFVQVFQQLEGCADVKENYISERMNSDSDIGHQRRWCDTMPDRPREAHKTSASVSAATATPANASASYLDMPMIDTELCGRNTYVNARPTTSLRRQSNACACGTDVTGREPKRPTTNTIGETHPPVDVTYTTQGLTKPDRNVLLPALARHDSEYPGTFLAVCKEKLHRHHVNRDDWAE
ncbi:hypothetical protein PR048_013541 [Dryococelus australis]|uniref:DDE-1 domain-containing protein n=1 Tax=Dryococelus australis TaxID=614101 RepID=A0ABQ9HSG2_9NEOP|nr:hypothetical protein PR048_013541 [Dryococelus australis]